MAYLKHILRITLCFVFVFLMGASKGSRDAMQFHNSAFIKVTNFDSEFWNSPEKTWCSKYVSCKDKTPRFFGSTTFLVNLTDGWHLFETFIIVFALLAIVFYEKTIWYFMIIDFFAFWIVRQAGFFLTYSMIFT